MALKTYKIGELVEACEELNSYGLKSFCGLNINKEFMPTAANTDGLNHSKYKVVRKHRFAFSGMQTGRDICIRIALYMKSKPIIVSPAYVTFEISKKNIVLPQYLFMIFLSKEKDRLGAFFSDGSIRSNLDWDRFCDIELRLPPIAVQRRFVDVYLSLQNNLAVYQSKTDDLKQVCEAKIEELKKSAPLTKIGKYIEICDETNANNEFTLANLRGISNQKTFIDSKADMSGVSLTPYLLVRPQSFAFVPVTSRNGEKITLAINDTDDTYIVSSSYVVFRIKPEASILPEYLFMYLSRADFDRYARFHSWGSAREVFTFADMQEVEIPIPPIDVQQGIVDIHRCMVERQHIAQKLKEEINHLCPILIKGSLEAGNSSVGTDEL